MTDTATKEELGYTSNIVPELQEYAIPIEAIKPHPLNPRRHRLEAIAESLLAHGQRSLIIVQKSSNFIVKGNGTHAAATMLGWDSVAALYQDLSDRQALEYLLADNRASDLGDYSRKELGSILFELSKGPQGLQGTLWHGQDVEDLREEFLSIAELPDAGTGLVDSERMNGEQKAAAAERLPGERLREVPMLFTESDHKNYVEAIRFLQGAWDMTGFQQTTFRAVLWAAHRVRSDAAAAKGENVVEFKQPEAVPKNDEPQFPL